MKKYCLMILTLTLLLTSCLPYHQQPLKPISGTITYKVANPAVKNPLCAYTSVLPTNASYPAIIQPNTVSHYVFTPDEYGVPYYLIYTVSSTYKEPFCIFHFREDKRGIYLQSRANDTNIQCKIVDKYNVEVIYSPPYSSYTPQAPCS